MLSVMAKPCRPTDGMHCTPPLILFETTKEEGVGWCFMGRLPFISCHPLFPHRGAIITSSFAFRFRVGAFGGGRIS